MFCCVIISSGLKGKKTFYVTKTKDVGKKKFVLFSSLRTPDLSLLLESPRPHSPPWGPQTSYQFLSTYLEIYSLNSTDKMMSLCRNTPFRFVIAFFPGSKSLLILWLQSPSAVILEPKKINSVTVSPSICCEVMGPDALSFLNVEFSASLFTLLFHRHQGAL